MQKILVPTDFSANADNATKFAIHIANALGSEIVLLHSYIVSSGRADVMKNLGKVVGNEAKGKMSKAILKFKPLLEGDAAISGEVLVGGAVLNAVDYAKKKGCSLIIMGTQGATGALEVFIGSTTGGVLKNSSVPVLAIPSDFSYQPLGNIVLALDSEPLPARPVFYSLQQLGNLYDAEIKIFHLQTDETEEAIDRNKVDSYLEGMESTYHEVSDGTDVHERINAFVKETGANLLCMVRRKRGFFESLLRGSATLKQVYDSPVPLLVLLAE